MIKKTLIFVVALLSLFSSLSITASCTMDNFDEFSEETEDELYSIMGDDIREELEKFGLDSFDFESIYNISWSSISDYFSTNLKEKITGVLKNFFILLSVVLIVSLIMTVFLGDGEEEFIGIITAIIVVLLTVERINILTNTVISVLRLSGDFMIAFIPIFAGIIAFAGNPSSALTYNTLVLAIAEGISAFSSFIGVNLVGTFFCLGISFSMNETVNTDRFLSMVNKITSFALGLLATVFTGLLSIRNVLSVSLDSVSVKGIRFVISSLVPIVGGAISDAYSSLLGSINLIKGSVAVVGIAVIALLNIPVIMETLLYYVSFSLLSMIAQSLNVPMVSSVFKCFSCGIRILLLLAVFEMFILIISTGIMLSFKGGA